MSEHIRRFIVPLIVAAAVTACGGDGDKQDTSALRGDSALASDLALANRDSGALPQLQDVPAGDTLTTPVLRDPAPSTPAVTRPSTTRPATRTPAPARPAPTPARPSSGASSGTSTGGSTAGPTSGTIGAGATLRLASSSKVCTNTHNVGDVITATTTETIAGTNGAVIPAGSTVRMTVTRLERSENQTDPIRMEFRVNSVVVSGRSYALDARVTDADIDRVRDQPKDKDVQKVVGGAVAGAIAGRILGKSTKSTVIGAAAGAAAGAGAAAATANYQGCINAGSSITVVLDGPVEIIRA